MDQVGWEKILDRFAFPGIMCAWFMFRIEKVLFMVLRELRGEKQEQED